MAKAKIDVYKDWLKIEATNRPLNYYQLMKLKPFEDDIVLIRKRYHELNEYIRKFATGEYIEESQALLNELARAMLCLTDTDRKSDYDFQLGKKDKPQQETTIGGRRSFEDILLENRILSPEQLRKAKMYSEAVGVDLEMAIIQQKAAMPETVMLAFAESQGLPFVNLEEVPVDKYYVPQIDPIMARQYSFIPVLSDMGKLILASPAPLSLDVETELEAMFHMPIRSAICTPAQINAAIAKYYPRGAVQRFIGTQIEDDETLLKQDKKGSSLNDDDYVPENVPAKKKKSKYAPLSKAAKANRLKMTIVITNFTFMLLLFGQYLMDTRMPRWGRLVMIALTGAAIAAGIAWYVNSKEIENDEDENEDENEDE